MLAIRFVMGLFAVGTVVLDPTGAPAQDYPARPIRIVTTEVGGGTDFAARLLAPGLALSLGQQVIVENRGGSMIIPAQAVARAPPDGYTLLFPGNPFWILPLLQHNVPYDPVKDFLPITLTNTFPNILVVHPSLPAKSIKELIALAKSKPGELSYASGANGSTSHLAPELFMAMAGVNIVRIAYKGSGPALNDLLGGQVHLMFPNAATATPHVKSRRLRALAVTSAEPSALFPGLPTVAASGLPGYESVTIIGLFAPAGTPAMIVDRLNRTIVQVVNKAETKERLFNAGIEVVGSSQEHFAATIKSEMTRMGKVIRDAGIHAE